MQDAFDEARIEHVFLHNVGESRLSDSDVDVGVVPAHLSAVEAVARSGRLGRLVQRLDYDVPWCRYYVFATGERCRPYRQLDVACDPFGIGRYGAAVPAVFHSTEVVEGLAVPSAGLRLVYLAAKRSQKGVSDERDVRQLAQAWAADPEDARTALTTVFGGPGAAAADALAVGDVAGALEAVGTAIAAGRRRPLQRARRATYLTRRIVSRVTRPTGLVVALVGPDGTGRAP